MTLISFVSINLLLTLTVPATLQSQYQQSKQTAQRETPVKANDLVHTRLDLHFDYKKRYCYGQEWVTIRPHFYPTDSVRLDAKGMNIDQVALIINGKKIPIEYNYDNLTLTIKLDRTYHRSETYTIYINYTSKPYELTNPRKDGRGLYFINHDGTQKNKPVQIWTQGETTYSSVWFPTIDQPNQKTTQEISMTVPAKYLTLSNGNLVSQKKNKDGFRTDTWRMEVPHSPYLFMIAVGDFTIYKDKWRGKEVSYYLEAGSAPYAKTLFGFTTEAMEFFSNLLGVPYPWSKYAQIRVRDYVSGAMENTSATVYGEDGIVTPRELSDVHYHQSGAIHELFHQWFGNYVTAESWSHLTVNESFATLENCYGPNTNLAEMQPMRNYQGGCTDTSTIMPDGKNPLSVFPTSTSRTSLMASHFPKAHVYSA